MPYAIGDVTYERDDKGNLTGRTAVLGKDGQWQIRGSAQMELPQATEDQLKGYQDQARDAQWLGRQAQLFKAGQAGAPGENPVRTGPLMKDIGIPHIAENINPIPAIAEAFDPRIKDLESISNQSWTHMRPVGSGAMRAPEIEGFQEGFPNIGNYGRANNLIADRLQRDAVYQAQQAKFIDNFVRGGQGTVADAQNAWMQQGQPPQQGQGGAPAVPPPMPMNADPNSPIGVSPVPGLNPGPAAQQTPQQTAILNWTPDKGLH